jgi:hypothetical protein
MSVVAGSNGRKLQVRAARHDGWTKARRILFIDTFAATCNTTLAAKACGMSDRSVRELKKRDPHFAMLCDEALQEGYERLEAELLARTLGHQIGDENPSADELGQGDKPAFDPQLAIKVLQMRDAAAKARSSDRRGRIFVRATQEETDAALERKLAAVERRLARTRA